MCTINSNLCKIILCKNFFKVAKIILGDTLLHVQLQSPCLRSSKDHTAHVATMSIKIFGKQLLVTFSPVNESRGTHETGTCMQVAVKKDRTVIGHLPRKLACFCSLFLRRGGQPYCTVTIQDDTLPTYFREGLRYHVVSCYNVAKKPIGQAEEVMKVVCFKSCFMCFIYQ